MIVVRVLDFFRNASWEEHCINFPLGLYPAYHWRVAILLHAEQFCHSPRVETFFSGPDLNGMLWSADPT